MVTKADEKLAKFFAKTFKEVVQPGLDKLQDTVDEIKENMSTKDDLYRVERRLEKIDDRLDRQGKVQDNLQKKVRVLESHASVVA